VVVQAKPATVPEPRGEKKHNSLLWLVIGDSSDSEIIHLQPRIINYYDVVTAS